MKTEHVAERMRKNVMFSNAELRALLFPLVIEQVLAITVGMADTMMISYAGEAAISGVSLVDMINIVLIRVFSAMATGGAVVISQYIGKGNRRLACDTANQLISVTFLVSGVVMALTIIARHGILSVLFGSVEQDVMDNAITYLVISAFSYPFLALFNSCAAAFRSMGNSRLAMFVSVGMNVMNAIGNAILIFYYQMGVAGAAWSTFASRLMAAAVLFFFLMDKNQEVFIELRRIITWNGFLARKILYIAVPSAIENGLFQFGRVAVVSIIALFGTAQIAANAVANNVDSMGCIVGEAMNLAVLTVVGQCIGAGDYDQAENYIKKMFRIQYIATWVINAIIFALLPWILGIYTLSDEARNLAMIMIIIHNGFCCLLWPLSFTLSHTLRSTGDVRYTMITAIFSMIVFRLVFSVLFGIVMGWGAIGVWIAMIFDWIFRSAMFYGRFRSGKWKNFHMV